jgi:holin-like protein
MVTPEFPVKNFSPISSARLARAVEFLLGLGIFCLFLAAGHFLKSALHLILPANVLGLLLLLAAISLKVIQVRHIEFASKWLLFLMPLLFVPIYAGAGAFKAIWIEWGWLLVPALIVSVIAMWIFVGHLSQAIGKISAGGSSEP